MWMEKEGAYGNAERRGSSGASRSSRRARRAPTCGSSSSSRNTFKVEEVWPEELIAKKPEYRGKTLYDVLFANGAVNKFPLAPAAAGVRQRRIQGVRLLPAERPVRGIRKFGAGKPHDLAPFDLYHKTRGLRWPVVDGKETLWRFREGYDPYVKAGEGVKFYGKPDGKAADLRAPTSRRRRRPTRTTTCGCAPGACSSTGTRAR